MSEEFVFPVVTRLPGSIQEDSPYMGATVSLQITIDPSTAEDPEAAALLFGHEDFLHAMTAGEGLGAPFDDFTDSISLVLDQLEHRPGIEGSSTPEKGQ